MTELPLTIPLVLRIWWAILWRQAAVQVAYRLAIYGLSELSSSFAATMFVPFLLLFPVASVAAVWWAFASLRRSGLLLVQVEPEMGSRRDRARAERVVQGLGLE